MTLIFLGIIVFLLGCLPQGFYIASAGIGYRNREAHIPSDGAIAYSRGFCFVLGTLVFIFGISSAATPAHRSGSAVWGSEPPEIYSEIAIGPPANKDINECEYSAIAYGVAGASDNKDPALQLESNRDGSLVIAFKAAIEKPQRIAVVESPDHVEIQIIGQVGSGPLAFETGCTAKLYSSSNSVIVFPLEKPLGKRNVITLSDGETLPLIESLSKDS